MLLHFTKMEGCGNDYIYINGFEEKVPDEQKPALARRLSDRHFGIGGDGLIFINPGRTAPFEMEMYNRDGSRGAMCGNGMRCVAKYLYDSRMTDRKEFLIESFGRARAVRVFPGEDGLAAEVTVHMGAPALEPSRIPFLRDDRTRESEPVVSEPIVVLGQNWDITCVSMGNPHAVVILPRETALARMDLTGIGPAFEQNPHFPERVNTEFVRPVDAEHVEMRVWERGSGETLACGTGCCAAAVACALNGVTGDRVYVRVPGGELLVEWDRERDEVLLTGPARTVFEGTVEL